MNTKKDISKHKNTNKIFSATYQKIEREKVNKMDYLYVGSWQVKRVLLVKYFWWLLIFEQKIVPKFSLFPLDSIIAKWDQSEFRICCTTFFALQNDKKTLKKKASLRVQIIFALLWNLLIFDDFSLKIRFCKQFSTIRFNFIAKRMSYLESAQKIALNHIFFHEEFFVHFFSKIRP